MNEKLLEIYTDMDNALEISHATLSTLSLEQEHDQRVAWVLTGVMEQIEKAQSNMNAIFESIKEVK